MKEAGRVITRRDFIRTGSTVALGSLAGLSMMGSSPSKRTSKSKVVLIRDKGALDAGGNPAGQVLERMLDQAVTVLMDAPDPGAAWKKLFQSKDMVGIKSNVWYHLPTPRALEETIRSRLVETGIREEHIDVDDRGILNNPVFQRANALINIRPMRSHHWSGLGTLLKNYIMFTDKPWAYHGNACETLGAVWKLPHVKGKTRLNILVMLTPLFHGVGPHHFSRRYIWPYGGLIVSRDPVAADATGARIIQAKRNAFFGKDRPISPPPLHIAAADSRFGLGNSHPQRIQLVRLGWDQDTLI